VLQEDESWVDCWALPRCNWLLHQLYTRSESPIDKFETEYQIFDLAAADYNGRKKFKRTESWFWTSILYPGGKKVLNPTISSGWPRNRLETREITPGVSILKKKMHQLYLISQHNKNSHLINTFSTTFEI